jgi:hypothetical protein
LIVRHLGIAKNSGENGGVEHRDNLAKMLDVEVARSQFESWALSQPWPKGEGANLLPKTKIFRLKVLMTALDHGRPLAVVDEYRNLLVNDGSSGTLTSAAHMAHLLPLVNLYLDHEFKSLKLYSVGIIFDGASDDGERVVSIARGVVVGESMRIVQRLLALVHMDRSYNSATLNGIINKGLVQNGVEATNVAFFVHDDVSVNKKSSAELKASIYSNVFDISCFSHVDQRIGENTEAPLVLLVN